MVGVEVASHTEALLKHTAANRDMDIPKTSIYHTTQEEH